MALISRYINMIAWSDPHVSLNWHLEDIGKLVSLRRYGLDHAIILNYVNEKKEAVGSRAYPMYFRLQDGKWILTR